jgi:hypothetical protein
MSFLKEHLQLTHYAWNDTRELYYGDPTRRCFDRQNGFQVLFLINCCSAFLETVSINEGRVIEERIINQLPVELKSEVSVFRWLRSGFLNDWLSA